MTAKPASPSSMPAMREVVSAFSESHSVAMTPVMIGASPNSTDIHPEGMNCDDQYTEDMAKNRPRPAAM